MTIQKTILENETVLALDGYLDTKSAPELTDALEALDADTPALVFFFFFLKNISSAGVRVLVAAHKKMGGKFSLRHVNLEVRDVLHMVGVDKRFHIEP